MTDGTENAMVLEWSTAPVESLCTDLGFLPQD